MSNIKRQNVTGATTEARVKAELEALGLSVRKPIPDRGVDLEARLPGRRQPVVTIQVKGRGAAQTNGRYRWFQIRTTAAERAQALAQGMNVADTWELKEPLRKIASPP